MITLKETLEKLQKTLQFSTTEMGDGFIYIFGYDADLSDYKELAMCDSSIEVSNDILVLTYVTEGWLSNMTQIINDYLRPAISYSITRFNIWDNTDRKNEEYDFNEIPFELIIKSKNYPKNSDEYYHESGVF